MVSATQKRAGAKTSSKKAGATQASSAPVNGNGVAATARLHASANFSEVFTSGFVKGIVLLLIMAFNALVLKNSFLLAAPTQGLSGDVELDALIYGLAIAVLMVIVLFHEERWEHAFCPGAITLYLNALILVLYTRWFEWLIGGWWTLWLISGLMTLLPVMGMFIMVVMLKPSAK